jgi:hypothetical protein
LVTRSRASTGRVSDAATVPRARSGQGDPDSECLFRARDDLIERMWGDDVPDPSPGGAGILRTVVPCCRLTDDATGARRSSTMTAIRDVLLIADSTGISTTWDWCRGRHNLASNERLPMGCRCCSSASPQTKAAGTAPGRILGMWTWLSCNASVAGVGLGLRGRPVLFGGSEGMRAAPWRRWRRPCSVMASHRSRRSVSGQWWGVKYSSA